MFKLRHWYMAAVVSASLGNQVAMAQPAPTTAPALTTAPAPTTAPATQPAQVVPEAALRAIEAKRYDDAIAILEPPAQSPDASFDWLAKLGGCYEQKATLLANDHTTAGHDRFKEYADKVAAYFLRAAKLGLDAGDPRAETLVRRVIILKPREPTALRLLGHIYQLNGSLIMAIAQYREYIKTPEGQVDYDAQVDLGRLLVAQGLWRQAVDLLEKISAIAGPDADQQLAMAYAAGRQPDKALEAAKRAVKSDRHSPQAFIVRASLLLQLGDRSDPRQALEDTLSAVQQAHDLLTASSTDEANWQKLSGWHQGIASISEALKGQARGGKLDAASELRLAEVLTGLGDLSRMFYDYDAALLLSNAARVGNAPVELLVSLAQRQRDLGLAVPAVQTAERILERDPSNAAARKIKETAGKRETK